MLALQGITVSPGTAIGSVCILGEDAKTFPRYHLASEECAQEVQRLDDAVGKTVKLLEQLRLRFGEEHRDHHAILDAYLVVVQDPSLLQSARTFITRDRVNAEWAIHRAVEKVREVLEELPDLYIAGRHADIAFVGSKIIEALRATESDERTQPIYDENTILVAHELSPVDAATLYKHRVAAIVTEIGGTTSHTSIVARSLLIPAVVGVHGLLDRVGDSDRMIVDGDTGKVYIAPTAQEEQEQAPRVAAHRQRQQENVVGEVGPLTTSDGWPIQVVANIEYPSEIPFAYERGANGIGLLRTEFLYLDRRTPPTREEQRDTYRSVTRARPEFPVTIRTFDLGGDKVAHFTSRSEPEPNPALGLRAIRFSLHDTDLFREQVAAILEASGDSDLRLVMPLVSCLDEVQTACDLIEEIKDQTGVTTPVPVGVMIEVPSALSIIDELAEICDFFAVGTNDLVQYLLAYDRSNDRVDYLYRPLHPAVVQALQTIQASAQQAGIPVSLCGEMAGDPRYIPVLLGMGFESLSMHVGALHDARRLIPKLDRAACTVLAEDVLGCRTHREALSYCEEFLEEIGQ